MQKSLTNSLIFDNVYLAALINSDMEIRQCKLIQTMLQRQLQRIF